MLLLVQPCQTLWAKRFSLNFPWLKSRQKRPNLRDVTQKNAFKGEQNKWKTKQKYLFEIMFFRKSVWSVFSPMCLIYMYSRRSKRLLVWENLQSCHWLTNSEPEPDYHTKNHQHQTPTPSIQPSWTSTCVLFWQSLKRWHKQYAFRTHTRRTHEHRRPRTANAHTAAQTQMLTYAGI